MGAVKLFSKRNLQIIAYCLVSVFATLCFVGWQMQQLTGNAAETLKFLRAMYVIKHNFLNYLHTESRYVFFRF